MLERLELHFPSVPTPSSADLPPHSCPDQGPLRDAAAHILSNPADTTRKQTAGRRLGAGDVDGDISGAMGGVWGDVRGMMGGDVDSGTAQISVAELERLYDEMDKIDMLAARDFEQVENVSETVRVWLSIF